MVCRLPALRCSLALGLLVPRLAAAEPPVDADAQTPVDPDDDPADAEAAPEDVEQDANEDEGSVEPADEAPAPPYPDRLPRLQRIGWYHVLGAFTLGTTAGLLAGLAEREEDRATRLAAGYDYETGSSVLYRDRQDEYERILDRGQAFQTSAIVLGALAGATTIAAITFFAVDARREKRETARRTRIGPGSVEVRF